MGHGEKVVGILTKEGQLFQWHLITNCSIRGDGHISLLITI